MQGRLGDDLLALPVRLHGVTVGRPADLLLDRAALHMIGFDILCGDDEHRFLPAPTAKVMGDEISISSPLVLLEEDELDFYKARAVSFASLRGRVVVRKRRELGTLRDVVVNEAGELVAVIVEVDGTRQRIPFDDALQLAPESRSAA